LDDCFYCAPSEDNSRQSGTRYFSSTHVIPREVTPDAKLFVGSENFSTDSLNDNRELGLIFSDPGCMTGVYTAITADYNKGTKF